jgi:hypothetical protein
MKTLLAVFSLAILIGAPSLAQAQTPRPTVTPRATPTPAPVATPAPIVAPEPDAASAPEAAAAPVARFEPGMGEPNDKTVGVGTGWLFPTSILSPNTVSVRFRLKSGLTIEPIANASFSQSFEHTHLVIGDNRPHVASRNYVADLGLGVQVRKPLNRRGPVELHFLASPFIGVTDSVDNPVGAQDRVFETSTIMGIGWGLGVEYFPPRFEQHWSLSMDATNPLFAFAYTTNYDQATNVRTNSTAYSLAAAFTPSVRGMVHLYY